MPRPQKHTDAEILAVAREVFLAHGAHAPTALVAERLGLSEAALFKRFGTKQALVMASVALPRPAWIEAVARGPEPGQPLAEQLLCHGRAMAAFLQDMAPCLATLRALQVDPTELMKASFDEPPPLRAVRAWTAFFKRAHKLGLAHIPHPAAFAHAFMGAIQLRFLLPHLAGQPAPGAREIEQHLRAVVETLCPSPARGLAADPAPAASPRASLPASPRAPRRLSPPAVSRSR
jgi:AcrR family transcriptional regulator